MALKRNYKGVEGYFFNSGNKKLVVEPGLIESARYIGEDPSNILNLGISKPSCASFIFPLDGLEDVSSLFEDFQVESARELVGLSFERRMVLVYSHNGLNYGISVCRPDRISGRLRI
jgi:hypothetical protein